MKLRVSAFLILLFFCINVFPDWDLPQVIREDTDIIRLEEALDNIRQARMSFSPVHIFEVLSDIRYFKNRPGPAANFYLLMYYISARKQKRSAEIISSCGEKFRSTALFRSLMLRYLLTFSTKEKVFSYLSEIKAVSFPDHYQDLFKVYCFYGEPEKGIVYLRMINSDDIEVQFWKDLFGVSDLPIEKVFASSLGREKMSSEEVLKYMKAGIINKKIISLYDSSRK